MKNLLSYSVAPFNCSVSITPAAALIVFSHMGDYLVEAVNITLMRLIIIIKEYIKVFDVVHVHYYFWWWKEELEHE